MPKVGLVSSVDPAVKKRWADIDLNDPNEMPLWYPADAALVALAIEEASARADVNSADISASQLENGIRQLLLQEATDYYAEIAGEIASIMGTIKHSSVNIEREGFITETRLSAPGVSAKCDTFHVPTGVLADLKNIKWYKIRMILENGVLAEARGYAFQLNLFRVLMQMPENQALLIAKYPWLKPGDLVVKKMQLTCVPPDMDAKNKKEAQKLVSDPRIIPIYVPEIPDAEVLAEYERKREAKAVALATGYAPLCTKDERWERNGFPTKCIYYCPVKDACIAMSAKYDEAHPVTVLNAKKAAA